MPPNPVIFLGGGGVGEDFTGWARVPRFEVKLTSKSGRFSTPAQFAAQLAQAVQMAPKALMEEAALNMAILAEARWPALGLTRRSGDMQGSVEPYIDFGLGRVGIATRRYVTEYFEHGTWDYRALPYGFKRQYDPDFGRADPDAEYQRGVPATHWMTDTVRAYVQPYSRLLGSAIRKFMGGG